MLFFTAALVLPSIAVLAQIHLNDTEPTTREAVKPALGTLLADIRSLVENRSLLTFAICIMLFHLASAAMLPLMGTIMATRSSEWATSLVAVYTVAPQLVVAACSPWVGRQAQRWGRRPLLLVCFAALALRALLFALVANPYLLVPVQLLDGITATILAIMFPLVVVDLTHDSGRFNLALGVMGTAAGIGASLSTTIAGIIADHFGNGAAFIGCAGVAATGLALVWIAMPETKPTTEISRPVLVAC